ncbi:hypothetical protein A2V80_02390 [Candidatus Woesebacteria bacterium RBG_16_39_8b]|uniref:Uncharacterized protein n=1 Tax=Candidatus Woesebacteria bacterium RBG_16_39_8b TaxID=1802482 RepID=A0A1F7X8J9_9BACT|nr:MAG: hypothetical protein A2V80_02390 [Candidatus Woesebacteria bacterium RBG_16_39_8b]
MTEHLHEGNYPDDQLRATVFEEWYKQHRDLFALILDNKSILQESVVLSRDGDYKISFEYLPECISDYVRFVDVGLLDVFQKDVRRNIGGLTISEPVNLAEIQLGVHIPGTWDRSTTHKYSRKMRYNDFALQLGSWVYFDNMRLNLHQTQELLANPNIVLFEILDIDIYSETITIGPSITK